MWGRIFKWPDDCLEEQQLQMTRRINNADTYEQLLQYAGGLEQQWYFSIPNNKDSRDHPEFSTMGLISLKSMLSSWFLGGQENFYNII